MTPVAGFSATCPDAVALRDPLSAQPNVVPLDPARRLLLAKKQEVFEKLLKHWRVRMGSPGKPASSTLDAYERAARHVLAVTGKFPWEMDEGDAWTVVEHLRNDPGISRNDTRRGTLIMERRYIEHIMSVKEFRRLIRREFGVEMTQPFRGRVMLSFHEKDEGGRRQALTHEHFELLFDTMKMLIRGAAHWREGLPLVRDIVMLFVAYVLGLRIREVLGLDVESFMFNPLDPDLRKYGRVIIKNGKGSNRSGPKTHIIPVLHPDLPALLKLYITKIRPYFVHPDNPGERGLFLSLDDGRKMTSANIDHRFEWFIEEAGLSYLEYVMHCLRHSCISHLRMSLPGDTVKEVARQSDIFVTDGYTHSRTEHLQAVCGGFIADEVEEATNMPDLRAGAN